MTTGTAAIALAGATLSASGVVLANSKRNRILDRIVVDLSAISASSGHHSTIPTGGCSRNARIGVEEPSVYFPLIDVVGGSERRDYFSCDLVESKFEVDIMCSVSGVDLVALENLIADIENKLADDTTLDGLAVQISCTSIETDGGTWSNSTAKMLWEVIYHHTFGEA